MVCVHYGPHGQRLIQRGARLAALIGAPLCVLTVDTMGENEYNSDKEMFLAGWENQTREAGGEFLVRKCQGRKTADVIADTAKERGITQIVLGQSSQTLWQEITRGSFINELMERIGAIDLHIVAVQRYPDMLEETHEEGFTAYLVKRGEHYELSDSPDGDKPLKGVFFRQLHTDFNTGLFKIVNNGNTQYLRIIQNEWVNN
ncbi:hypothetical protein PSTEL_11370 [Paenibacillus stellifer]|uniref:UspA domain-containing protein n=2 Tax=Paenibacillus stellifer TaxID=169760 RepID=A0A089LRR2_9BACL|nr:hypothetical protein PSTEL_11370 [Paenibacillus stellifer]